MSNSNNPNAKQDFGKNTFLVFKQATFHLPLKRVDQKSKESAPSIILEEEPARNQ